MMDNGYPKRWIGNFDNAVKPLRDLSRIPGFDSWQSTAYRSGS